MRIELQLKLSESVTVHQAVSHLLNASQDLVDNTEDVTILDTDYEDRANEI